MSGGSCGSRFFFKKGGKVTQRAERRRHREHRGAFEIEKKWI
jgi:hypothetical protein